MASDEWIRSMQHFISSKLSYLWGNNVFEIRHNFENNIYTWVAKICEHNRQSIVIWKNNVQVLEHNGLSPKSKSMIKVPQSGQKAHILPTKAKWYYKVFWLCKTIIKAMQIQCFRPSGSSIVTEASRNYTKEPCKSINWPRHLNVFSNWYVHKICTLNWGQKC